MGDGFPDLLRSGKAKDVDAATNATPKLVHELYRRGRRVGRAFKSWHIAFVRVAIMATTFPPALQMP